MLLDILIFYLLSFVINYKILIIFYLGSYILNRYNNKLKSFTFYLCIPYNLLLILSSLIKYKLYKYSYFKKYFKLERDLKKFFFRMRKKLKIYIRRKIMNYRIYLTTHRITRKYN